MTTAVITAIFGNTDALHEPVRQTRETDFYCFCEKGREPPHKTGTMWRIVTDELYEQCDRTYRNGKLKAKWYKLQFNKITMLKKYDFIIWVDGSVQIKSKNFVSAFMNRAGGSICVFRHPWRQCVYKEAEKVKGKLHSVNEPVINQIAYYNGHRYPVNNGLYCGTVFGMYREERLNRLLDFWWGQVKRFSARDQLSLPYCLWKLKIKPSIFEGNVYQSKYFTKERHTAYYELISRNKKAGIPDPKRIITKKAVNK
jgi:hypothetical protein